MPESRLPYVPENITVHLGRPDQPAQNVTLPFVDYIKNVASSEIYPTWPEAALRANIYAIITFALNRIYTEWYRTRGYDFDITNSTQFDQAFVPNREVFENISNIVDDIFNDYVVRQGNVEPFFTQFCNGTTALCDGLSQWGTVALAEQGYTPYQILQHYYGDNINIVRDAPVQAVTETYPGTPLQPGTAGNGVQQIQLELNRIAQNYPAIPRIPATNGIFDNATEDAVRAFQQIFNLPVTGTVDKATWYKIKRYYVGVKQLGELLSEGISSAEIAAPFPQQLVPGMKGEAVRAVQYYLAVIGYFNPSLPQLTIDGDYGDATTNAVRAFQRFYGLPETGNVDRATWNRLLQVYDQTLGGLPADYQNNTAKLYPGYHLTLGDRGQDVTDLQTYLSRIGEGYAEMPIIPITGYFGTQTRDAVYTFQQLFGLPLTGAVGPLTWNSIANAYNALMGVA